MVAAIVIGQSPVLGQTDKLETETRQCLRRAASVNEIGEHGDQSDDVLRFTADSR